MKPASRIIVRIALAVCLMILAAALPPIGKAQTEIQAQTQTPPSEGGSAAESSTSTDLYVMLGSDLVRPGWLPKANYNIGIGHTFGFLKKDPFGDELTFAYTYEDAGAGFWHSNFGSDTESFGVMKNFNLPRTKRVTAYTWIQAGVTTFTGGPSMQNEFYNGESIGAIVHFNDHSSIWIQETLNVIVTVPIYTTTSIGYTHSW